MTTRAKNIATDTLVEEMCREREEQGFTGLSSHTDSFYRSKSWCKRDGMSGNDKTAEFCVISASSE